MINSCKLHSGVEDLIATKGKVELLAYIFILFIYYMVIIYTVQVVFEV